MHVFLCARVQDIFPVPLQKAMIHCHCLPVTQCLQILQCDSDAQTNGAKALIDIFICNQPVFFWFICPVVEQDYN